MPPMASTLRPAVAGGPSCPPRPGKALARPLARPPAPANSCTAPRARPRARPSSPGGPPPAATSSPYAFAPYRESPEAVSSSSSASTEDTLAVPSYAPSAPPVPVAMELPRAVESPVDNPRLANPLARMERISTGWMGVILELEGVLVPDAAALHEAAWLEVAAAEGRPLPHRAALARTAGMKDEQVVSEALAWSRSPAEVRRLARLKADAFDRLAQAVGDAAGGGGSRDRGAATTPSPLTTPAPGAARFLSVLASHGIPTALATAAPPARLAHTLAAPGLPPFTAVVSGADVARGRPDPEPFLVAAAALGRPPSRCVLVGNSNASVEAAREAGMACIAVAGGADEGGAAAAALAAAAAAGGAPLAAPRGPPPRYELAAADLVVSGLGDLTLSDLKGLFRNEEPVEGLAGGGGAAAVGSTGRAATDGTVDDDERDDDLDALFSGGRGTSLDDELASAASSQTAFVDAADDGDDDLSDVILPPWVDRRAWEAEQRAARGQRPRRE